MQTCIEDVNDRLAVIVGEVAEKVTDVKADAIRGDLALWLWLKVDPRPPPTTTSPPNPHPLLAPYPSDPFACTLRPPGRPLSPPRTPSPPPYQQPPRCHACCRPR